MGLKFRTREAHLLAFLAVCHVARPAVLQLLHAELWLILLVTLEGGRSTCQGIVKLGAKIIDAG